MVEMINGEKPIQKLVCYFTSILDIIIKSNVSYDSNLYNFVGMICPITTEQITKDTKDNDDLILRWQTVFCIASGIHFFGVAFYALFASGELQDWAKAEPKEETMEMNNDFEKPNNGYAYGANPNVVTGGQEQQSFLQGETVDYSDGGSAQPSANPFTSGQNNPFRQ